MGSCSLPLLFCAKKKPQGFELFGAESKYSRIKSWRPPPRQIPQHICQPKILQHLAAGARAKIIGKRTFVHSVKRMVQCHHWKATVHRPRWNKMALRQTGNLFPRATNRTLSHKAPESKWDILASVLFLFRGNFLFIRGPYFPFADSKLERRNHCIGGRLRLRSCDS